MAKGRRGSVRARLADLEQRAGAVRERECRRVMVYLPRKDGDDRPAGVVSRVGAVRTVLYDRDRPDPARPDGW